MVNSFLRNRYQNYVRWRHAPATRRDRTIGAAIGGMGCFWIGILGRLALSPLPVSMSALAWWALGSVLLGVMLGIIFPKIVSVVCLPFSSFGGGS
ncbi:MAG: hypothetical protein M3Q12_03100 [Pseudomonadota bacterium]|uniref:hypothetical protein n=1 Tax=Polaromonas sp. TaxID=1869339 RepID=UPI0017F64814|nr:hypothetical protein [Polaromonas sp.]MBA3595353.1 hypothetical protein [Polaromonas sp.]MDQ3271143.1 hypothetical protein [Pseudomonadota bacterium]